MTTAPVPDPPQADLSPSVRALIEDLVAMRRRLHAWPELGMRETRTAATVAGVLRDLGLEVREGIGGTGVLGVLATGRPGKTLLLRADMDGLPIKEQTGAPYASTNEGVMHACGHDGHVAILLAAARVLSAQREDLRGNLVFCFQPAEEGPGGARPMIEAGALDSPKVDLCLGLHLWNDLPVGTVGVRAGPFMAAVDEIAITVRGRGGHASAPHQTIDPVAVAAQLVTGLYNLRSREIDAQESMVISITSIHAGKAFNVVPDEALLGGTVRTFDARLRQSLPERVDRVARGIASAYGATAHVDYRNGYPATINDPAICDALRRAAATVVGTGGVVEARATMGGEDMAYFLQKVPGCFFFLGSANAVRGLASPHHSPRFDIDEGALPIGVEIFVRAARALVSS